MMMSRLRLFANIPRSIYGSRKSMATFTSEESYMKSLPTKLPSGFRVGAHKLGFRPQEVPTMQAKMTVTLISMDKPTDSFAALFTKNAFPGAPVIVGRSRMAEKDGKLQAVVINNKVSNVCAPGGVEAAEEVCSSTAKALGLSSSKLVFPSSTGVIGWRIPVKAMTDAIPAATQSLQRDSILPAAIGICTTDLYPKVRSEPVPNSGGGFIVGIAKGAGMVEPNLATMLVYILTDVSVPRDVLRSMLPRACDVSFNAISVDSDTSTSDTVLLLSSKALPPLAPEHYAQFEAALTKVCSKLSEDIVRNGEGVSHVIRVKVRGATTDALARAVGKSIINSPLFKCAVAGNDPNVGRLVAAIGKCVGSHADGGHESVSQSTTIRMGGLEIYSSGQFRLSGDVEKALIAHLKEAQLWVGTPTLSADAKPIHEVKDDSGGANSEKVKGYAYRGEDVSFVPPVKYPRHEKCVEIEVDLGMRNSKQSRDITVLGSDLTHEYVAENADYRS